MVTQAEISAGDIQAAVTSKGRFGWCGLSHLSHKHYAQEWLLSPALTLEHYLGVPKQAKDYIAYEPCSSPKHLEAHASTACCLHYDPLSCSHVECHLAYQAVAPHYIDVTVQAKTSRADWPFNYLALFFATIVRTPLYAGINFLGKDLAGPMKGETQWIHFNGLAGESGRVVHPDGVTKPELTRPADPGDAYYYDDSSVRFVQPYFYAQIESMVFAVMFHPRDKDKVRFVVNPVAPAFGGPAWDFFWIIEDPIPKQSHTLSFRTLFKPFVSRDDISKEYAKAVDGEPLSENSA